MNLTLYTPKTLITNGTKVDVVAKFLQVPLEYNRIPFTQWKSPEYLQKHPLGKIPLLQTPQGCIYESMAICRYLARKTGKMYGNSPAQTAMIDQWLEMINTQLAPIQRYLVFGIMGYPNVQMNKQKFNQSKKQLIELLKMFDANLKDKDFIASKEISIADVILASNLRYFMCLLLDQKTRSGFPKLTQWFVRMMETPQCKAYFGKTWLCQKQYVPDYEYFAQAQKQKQEAAKNSKVQQKEKKQQPKKQEKKKAVQEQDQEQKPKKKQVNPLDLLPKSNFVLDDFKRDFVNSQDLRAGMDKFWQIYDAQGWSLWKLHYVLYQGQGKVGYLTCNLKNGFIRNLDHFRKYSFGVIGVYGQQGDLVIQGAMLWRGTQIPNEWKEHNSYDYFEFKKLDHTNAEDKKLIESYWINIDGRGEGPVEGKPLWQAKWFK